MLATDRNEEGIAGYSRSSLAERLAGLLDEIAA
jgi:hypothetical protein